MAQCCLNECQPNLVKVSEEEEEEARAFFGVKMMEN
jgi:hypothetical protein